MVTGTDTVLVLGTDQRPKGTQGAGRQHQRRRQPLGHDHAVADRRRHLAPAVDPARHGRPNPRLRPDKINAAYAYGGPALTIKTIEEFTGVKINHLIIVNLANFPKFIDAIGGVDVTTGRICSNISGGRQERRLHAEPPAGHPPPDGRPGADAGAHAREHLQRRQSNDLTRDGYQQKILNGIKSRLLSPGIFFHLPWASWDAPKAVRTDMGGFTLLSLFFASEIGGSAPTDVLKPTGSTVLPDGGDALVATPGEIQRAVHKLMNG